LQSSDYFRTPVIEEAIKQTYEYLRKITLSRMNDEAGQFRQDVAAWKAGDTARLYAIHTGEMKEAPTVWWRLLDRRNARWVPRIETAIRSGRPTLIVAGALHFAGPRGVIGLLEKRGYKIEQL